MYTIYLPIKNGGFANYIIRYEQREHKKTYVHIHQHTESNGTVFTLTTRLITHILLFEPKVKKTLIAILSET